MLNWKVVLRDEITPSGGRSPIVGFNDERKIVEVAEDADLDVIRRIEQAMWRMRVPYEVRQVSPD